MLLGRAASPGGRGPPYSASRRARASGMSARYPRGPSPGGWSAVRSAEPGERTGTAEQGVEHRLGQPAGEGVVLARGGSSRARSPARRGRPPRPRRRGRTAAAAGVRRTRRRASARQAASQPKPPRQTTARRCGASRVISRCSQGAQVSRSSGVGWFAGGAHRTVATIRAPAAPDRPRRAARSAGWRGRPGAGTRTASRREESPVKTRPVRFAPCAAGARPTTTSRASGSPQPAIGRPQ